MVVPLITDGDLLDQPVDVIVNPWNRNVLPWWLLLPQGVSGAILRRAGRAPFVALAKLGPIPLGGAVLTTAGRLPYKGIIHVAGINLLWRASAQSIHDSALAAMAVVAAEGFASVAFPVIGAGTGGLGEDGALAVLVAALGTVETGARVVVVRFRG